MNNQNPAPFLMPAEWEPHAATWIAWPHNREDWPSKFDAIPWVYGEIVRHVHQAEKVNILTNGIAGERKACAVLSRLPLDWERIVFVRLRTDRVWTRDYAPMFVKTAEGSITLVDWSFNAWAKYDDWQHDNRVTEQIAAKLQLPSTSPSSNGKPVVLEGGSIDVNGQGLLLTTEECLLSEVQQRNPGLSRSDYESLFSRYLGVSKVIWLKKGIVGDD